MENGNGREALGGAEVETFDLIAEILTPKEWAKLLKAPLQRSAARGKRGLARKLVRAGAETRGALYAAIRGGDGGILNDLLGSGVSLADKDVDGNAPLHLATQMGKTEMVQLLILKGADKDALNNNEMTPLFLAVSGEHVGAASALLAAGADVNLQCGSLFKKSAVHEAARAGYADILRAAIEHGADVNAGDRTNDTPLHHATFNNQVEAIDVLVEAGANIEARNIADVAPLHCAASNFQAGAVLALLQHGANINARDSEDRTPLFNAAASTGKEGAAEVVDLLLRSGADETITGEEGKTPADVIGQWFEEYEDGDPLVEEVERVRRLLANAPADRAWRRRGYLVLCRAHPDIVHRGKGSSRTNVGMARETRCATKPARAEGGGGDETDGGGMIAGDGTDGNWAVVMAKVLGLHEEDIFRTIVVYL